MRASGPQLIAVYTWADGDTAAPVAKTFQHAGDLGVVSFRQTPGYGLDKTLANSPFFR